MKHIFTLAISIVLLVFTVSLSSAQTAGTSTQGSTAQTTVPSMYVKILYVSKIYPHDLGYKVNYWSSGGTLQSTYLPLTWFGTTGGKGEIVSRYSRSVPYMELVFSDGKFKMVRLHIAPSFYHRSWGSLTDGVDISGNFKVDAPSIVY